MVRFLTVFLFLICGQPSSGQTYSIILGRPTQSSVTLSFLFDADSDFFIEYGVAKGNYPLKSSTYSLQAGKTSEILVTELTKNTRYYYRVKYKKASATSYLASPEYNFHTQRDKGSTFSFTVESDEHLYDKKGVRSMYLVTLNNQAQDEPDFMFSLGDIFGDDHYPITITSEEVDALHKDYRQYLGTICHSIPLFISLGNHEGENDYYLNQNPPDNLAIWGTQWRKYYYPNPMPNDFYSGNSDNEPYGVGQPQNYYAWTWGDALFVVLDVYRYQSISSPKPQNWDWTLGKKQYDWLRSTLETSTAKYKFVFAHHNRGQGRGGILPSKLFEWGGYNADGKTWGFDISRPGWGKPIHQLFKDNGVNIFFQGHDHLFAHEVMDGVHYQTVPMPSDSTYMIGKLANADAFVSDTLDGTGHIRVTVDPSCVSVDYVKAYLPKDTLGIRKNREIGFHYNVGCTITGIEEWSEEQEAGAVIVYPNPVEQKLYLRFKEEPREWEASMFSITGEKWLTGNNKEWDVRGIPNGSYLIVIRTSAWKVVKKIIIQH
jgi:hypothetical protein